MTISRIIAVCIIMILAVGFSLRVEQQMDQHRDRYDNIIVTISFLDKDLERIGDTNGVFYCTDEDGSRLLAANVTLFGADAAATEYRLRKVFESSSSCTVGFHGIKINQVKINGKLRSVKPLV